MPRGEIAMTTAAMLLAKNVICGGLTRISEERTKTLMALDRGEDYLLWLLDRLESGEHPLQVCYHANDVVSLAVEHTIAPSSSDGEYLTLRFHERLATDVLNEGG